MREIIPTVPLRVPVKNKIRRTAAPISRKVRSKEPTFFIISGRSFLPYMMQGLAKGFIQEHNGDKKKNKFVL